jgi:hypothetical protein
MFFEKNIKLIEKYKELISSYATKNSIKTKTVVEKGKMLKNIKMSKVRFNLILIVQFKIF